MTSLKEEDKHRMGNKSVPMSADLQRAINNLTKDSSKFSLVNTGDTGNFSKFFEENL